MPIGRVNAAKFIGQLLPEPHETDFGGKGAHHRMATAFADRVCPPSGHSIGWHDCYLGAKQLPFTLKADLFLEPNGEPRSIPPHLVGEARERAEWAGKHAAWIRREAHRRGLH